MREVRIDISIVSDDESQQHAIIVRCQDSAWQKVVSSDPDATNFVRNCVAEVLAGNFVPWLNWLPKK